jgi:hypothetical protein
VPKIKDYKKIFGKSLHVFLNCLIEIQRFSHLVVSLVCLRNLRHNTILIRIRVACKFLFLTANVHVHVKSFMDPNIFKKVIQYMHMVKYYSVILMNNVERGIHVHNNIDKFEFHYKAFSPCNYKSFVSYTRPHQKIDIDIHSNYMSRHLK